MTEKAQGCWSSTFLILVHMVCQVNDVKYDICKVNTKVCFFSVNANSESLSGVQLDPKRYD